MKNSSFIFSFSKNKIKINKLKAKCIYLKSPYSFNYSHFKASQIPFVNKNNNLNSNNLTIIYIFADQFSSI